MIAYRILAATAYMSMVATMQAVHRWLEPTRICGACLGFGNRTAISDDTETVCGCCHGSGWIYR